jgi:hypothetical protein
VIPLVIVGHLGVCVHECRGLVEAVLRSAECAKAECASQPFGVVQRTESRQISVAEQLLQAVDDRLLGDLQIAGESCERTLTEGQAVLKLVDDSAVGRVQGWTR